MIKFAKFLLRLLLRALYRVEVSGMQHYHAAGQRVLIIANHTSLLDGLLLYAWLPETPTFAINTQIAQKKLFKPFLKFVDLFLMDPVNALAIKSMIRFIQQDRKAVIFPEGRITVTGSLMKIYDGPAVVADKSGASILPISIDGPQFGPQSYMQGKNRLVWFPKIYIRVLKPEKIMIDDSIHGHERRKYSVLQLQDIMYRIRYNAFNTRTDVFNALIFAANRFGRDSQIIEDINRKPLSYRDILIRAIFIGRWISSSYPTQQRIGILLPNVCATVFTFMAVHYARRVPAMLNYTAGMQAMRKACDLAGITTILTSRKFIENVKLQNLESEIGSDITLVYLEDLIEQSSLVEKIICYLVHLQLMVMPGKFADIDPDHPAVILFTSGSEGIPKGVVLSHANLLSNNAQVCCHIDFQVGDKIFTCLPLFHSFGLNVGCLVPLFNGSNIFLYPTPLHYRLVPELIYETGATVFFSANTFLKGYARYAHPYDFNRLRYVVAGAEKLHDDTLDLWFNRFGIRILQGYGVTETSPVISVNTPMQYKAGTVGRAMPYIECSIQPIEGIDQGGKLLVKGPNVMSGYLQQGSSSIGLPQTTLGSGWYDTGDIADIDEQGFISILGRAKRFAKLGGEMISLSAVEELALLVWPDHDHAALSVYDERKGEKIILVTNNPQAERKFLQEHARQNGIGELYIPRIILKTEKLPRLGSGKTDYITLVTLVEEEAQTGNDWIHKLGDIISGT